MSLPIYLKFLENNAPDFGEAIEKVFTSAMTPGALDQKTKLLIALAVDAVHGAGQGVASIANHLRIQGTTNAEIAEALRIAYFASGNTILAASSAAFPSDNNPK